MCAEVSPLWLVDTRTIPCPGWSPVTVSPASVWWFSFWVFSLYICTVKYSGDPVKVYRVLFIWEASCSTILLSANSSHLGLLKLHILPPQLRETAMIILFCPTRCCDLESLSRQWAGTLVGLTSPYLFPLSQGLCSVLPTVCWLENVVPCIFPVFGCLRRKGKFSLFSLGLKVTTPTSFNLLANPSF